jgi:hypothetical protein
MAEKAIAGAEEAWESFVSLKSLQQGQKKQPLHTILPTLVRDNLLWKLWSHLFITFPYGAHRLFWYLITLYSFPH